MEKDSFIIEQIEKEAGIALQENWQTSFQEYINHLINNDFEKLVFLLYRIDVSEQKIKTLLENTSALNAGELITEAIIERIEEKKAAREKYKQTGEISEEEKW
jgi:exo-beta-1,3-glucanase (GH17 family)